MQHSIDYKKKVMTKSCFLSFNSKDRVLIVNEVFFFLIKPIFKFLSKNIIPSINIQLVRLSKMVLFNINAVLSRVCDSNEKVVFKFLKQTPSAFLETSATNLID